jgi:hypothetical protein
MPVFDLRRDITLPPFSFGGKELNVLKPHPRSTVRGLLATGRSQLEIERSAGVDRKTIHRNAQ